MKQLLVLAFTLACFAQSQASAQASPRAYSTARFALTIDGQQAGFLSSFAGGNAFANVVRTASSGELFAKKHIADLRYEQMTIQLSITPDQPLQQWLATTLRGQGSARDGAVIGYDNRLTAVQQRNFFGAQITEVTFPALDASSREPGLLTVLLAAERLESVKPAGSAAPAGLMKQKAFISSNFRIELDGLNTAHVSKIDAFAVKQKVTPDAVGQLRDQLLEPTAIEIPNLTVTFSAAALDSWQRWFDDFVIRGENGDNREKHGRIVFLAPNMQEELLSIELSNVGIFALRPRSPQSGADTLSQYEAQLYVEGMELETR